ncbi:MAG: TIGR00159 family protein [Myxococcales bacterium]|nr:TIGR00159 family protein [Myxococcales bacterium]
MNADWLWEPVRVVIDVTIVSYLVYRTLLLIKGTRAIRMLAGIVILILLFFVSKDEYFDLPTLNWVLDKFIASFIILIIVVFQDDIRRALSQVGKKPIVGGGQNVDTDTLQEEVVRAVTALSAQRLGAIIAIERSADLSSYTEEGVPIDGRVSRELLFSIFLTSHQNPLHDGAVMIQKGRIAYAGCFLPLTVNPKVDRELGTRHRAAIGLSEETDAVVLVVSEESGAISLALHGELMRDFDAQSLRRVLNDSFGGMSRSTLWRRFGRAKGGSRTK